MAETAVDNAKYRRLRANGVPHAQAVAMAAVTPTADFSPPSSLATDVELSSALAVKAPLASPAFTGTPTKNGSPVQSQADVAGAYRSARMLYGTGIDPTGTADSTTAAQAILTAAPVGSTVAVPVGALIATTGLSIPTGVTFDMRGGRLKALPGGLDAVVMLGTNATLLGDVLDCNNVAGKAGLRSDGSTQARGLYARVINSVSHGYRFEGCTRPELWACDSDAARIGLLLNSGTIGALIQGGRHLNCTTTTNFEAAVYVPNASECRLVGVEASFSAVHGFVDGGTDNHFVACQAKDNGNTDGAHDHRGVTLNGSVRSQWTDCDFLRNAECGFYNDGAAVDTKIVGGSAVGNNVGLRPGGSGYEMLGPRAMLLGVTSQGQHGAGADSGHGMFVGSSVSIINAKIRGNWCDGVNAGALSSGHRVIGCDISNNGQRSPGTGHGINQAGGIVLSQWIYSGNHCYDDQASKTQGYGLVIGNANIDYGVCVGNVARATENLTGGLYNGGGTHTQVANNIT